MKEFIDLRNEIDRTDPDPLSNKYRNALTCKENVLFVNTGEKGYKITVKRGALSKLDEYIKPNGKVLIVTDDGVPLEHVEKCRECFKDCDVLTLDHGESNKNIGSFLKIIDSLKQNGFTRSDCVLALGGGVVGDTAGFAASAYMRGIDFYNVPTTLLSQVDSSVGGKVAIDHDGGKNLIGAFYDPKAVVIDPDVLATLESRQISNGLAELIKIAATCDAELFEKIERGAFEKEPEKLIFRAVQLKSQIVERDPKEASLRRVLNFGHTLGHAIESASGLCALLHGECVALGMIPMCAPEIRPRLVSVLRNCGLPTEFTGDRDRVKLMTSNDKKKHGKNITLVRVPQIGRFVLEDTPYEAFAEQIDGYLDILGGTK